MYLIDGHLDLSYNALHDADLTQSVAALAKNATGDTRAVTFGSLQEAEVRLCFATLFAERHSPDCPEGYTTPTEAHQQALKHLALYRQWQEAGYLRILVSGKDIQQHIDTYPQHRTLGVILLMEGAEPILSPEDLQWWHSQGLRMVGPAWGKTRFAGGTNEPGGLTEEGHWLVQGLKDLDMVLDVSHLDDAAFWQAVDIHHKVIASHSNTRIFTDRNRHLSDGMIDKIGELGGVIGIVPFNVFLKDGWVRGMPKNNVDLSHMMAHTRHIAKRIGWDKVAIGSDFDGGFGIEQMPKEIHAVKDLHRFIQLLPEPYQTNVAHGNWLRWLIHNMP